MWPHPGLQFQSWAKRFSGGLAGFQTKSKLSERTFLESDNAGHLTSSSGFWTPVKHIHTHTCVHTAHVHTHTHTLNRTAFNFLHTRSLPFFGELGTEPKVSLMHARQCPTIEVHPWQISLPSTELSAVFCGMGQDLVSVRLHKVKRGWLWDFLCLSRW